MLLDKYIVVMAWTNLAFNILGALLLPFIFGSDRGKYNASYWLAHVITTLLYLPIIGRILGWW